MTKRDKIENILKNGSEFTIQNNAYCFLPGNRIPHRTAGKGLLGNIQDQLKKCGKPYYSLLEILGPVFTSVTYRRSIRQCLKKYTENHIVINLGSGPRHFKGRTDIINIDLFAFDEVDMVADSCQLPIKNQSVDFILNIAMLEHVKDPTGVVQEMYRILKPNGEVFAYAPFMQPFHAAPHDYYRWTRQGLKHLFLNFDIRHVFVGCGPTSGMLYIMEEWLSTFLSFGSRTLHDLWFLLFMILLFPIKYLDLILEPYKFASNVASGHGLVARRPFK